MQVLYLLAGIAASFALYSFGSYFFAGKNWRAMLKGIALLNLAYCCLSLCFVYLHLDVLTTPGLMYFMGEKLILIPLAIYEWRYSNS